MAASKETHPTEDGKHGSVLNFSKILAWPVAVQSDNVTRSTRVKTRFYDNVASMEPPIRHTHMQIRASIRPVHRQKARDAF